MDLKIVVREETAGDRDELPPYTCSPQRFSTNIRSLYLNLGLGGGKGNRNDGSRVVNFRDLRNDLSGSD